MRVYVQTQYTTVQADLAQLVRDTMTSGTFKTWNSIEEYLDNVPNGRIDSSTPRSPSTRSRSTCGTPSV